MKLDIGCGSSCAEGFVGVDFRPTEQVSVVADLTQPWPFGADSVEAIRASHIVEHLPKPLETMNEAFRVLKAGAIFDIDVPSTNGMGAFQDPTHCSYWNINSFIYYDRQSLLGGMYGCNKWDILQVYEYNSRGIEAFGPYVKAVLQKPV